MNPWLGLLSYALTFLLVFGLSASVDVRALSAKFKKRTGIITGLGSQFFLLPVFGLISVKLFGLSEVQGITLLVITSSPGGSYSNLWCSLFNADLALSVAMTTASTIVAAVMLPVNLLIYISAAYNKSGTHKQSVFASISFKSLSERT